MIKTARITKWSETIDILPKSNVSGNLKTVTHLLPSLGAFSFLTSANVAQIISNIQRSWFLLGCKVYGIQLIHFQRTDFVNILTVSN